MTEQQFFERAVMLMADGGRHSEMIRLRNEAEDAGHDFDQIQQDAYDALMEAAMTWRDA